jgi:hypothetical protein
MPSEMFGDVILTRDVPERGLRAGDVGTVEERHVVPDGREEGDSVEFFDMTGSTVAIETLPASAPVFSRGRTARPYEPSARQPSA